MKKNSLILLSALLFVLTLAPFGFWYLSFFYLVPILVISSKFKKSVIINLSIVGCIIGAVGWYGVVGAKWYYLIYPLLVVSIAYGIWGYLYYSLNKLINDNYLLRLFLLSLAWVAIERVVASEYIGLPTHLAMSLAMQPLLIQFASILGIYGVSLIVIFSNLAVSEVITEVVANKKSISWKKIIIICLSLGSVALLNIAFGFHNINKSSDGNIRKISIASVQPMISRDVYYNLWRNQKDRVFAKNIMEDLTNKAAKMNVDMVVWPEGGNGFLNMRVSKLRDYWYDVAKNNNIDLLISTNDINESGDQFNSIFSISREGNLLGNYYKNILVPFEENYYSRGVDLLPLPITDGMAGSVICYESAFSEPARKLTELGAGFLFVSTSDVSFLNSSIALGHAQLSIFRAIENSRWLVHSSNAGPSLFITPEGKVDKESGFYTRSIVKSDVYIRSNITFYTAYGYLIIELFVLVFIMLLGYFLFEDFRCPKKSRGYKVIRKSRNLDNYKIMLEVKTLIYKVLNKSIKLIPFFIFIVIIVIFNIYSVSLLYKNDVSIASALGEFIRPQQVLHKNTSDVLFKQAKNNTCGPASLAYLLSYYGFDTTEEEVLEYVTLTRDGITMFDMKKAVEHYNFSAIGYKENYTALQNESLPVIAYINNSHYVVLLKVTPGMVVMFDPNIGNIAVSRERFISIWNGYLLSLKTQPIVANKLKI